MSAAIQVCKDTSEAVELCRARGIYLKPLAKLNICVQLPSMKTPGQSISNWEVMEKLKKMIRPNEFSYLKISKATLDFMRFEAEVENRSLLKNVLSRLDGATMKHTGFPDAFKMKAAEAKLNFPSRHDWDSFYRDARNMNEMKPGERPDTIQFSYLPIKWFSDSHSGDKPSERIMKEIFESLGDIRCLDIPMNDQYHKDLNKSVGAIKTFSFNQELVFDAYVQFKEYVGFVKAMDSLRGMKLVYKSLDGKAHIANIKADFDRTKHLSAKNIRRRIIERQKLMNLEKQKEARVHREREEEEKMKEDDRKRQEEEESRRDEKKRKREQHQHQKEKKRQIKLAAYKKAKKIAVKQRKQLVIRRRKEARAVLAVFLENARKKDLVEKTEAIEKERIKQQALEEKQRLAEVTRQVDLKRVREENLLKREESLREKLLLNLKAREEKRTEEIREKLRKELAGRKVLKSVLGTVECRDNRADTPAIKSFFNFPVQNYQNAKRHFYKQFYGNMPYQPNYEQSCEDFCQPNSFHNNPKLFHNIPNGKKVVHKKTCPRYNKFKTERNKHKHSDT